MNKRQPTPINPGNKLTVDISELMAILGVGRDSARKIAAEAGATVHIGKRVVYRVRDIEAYINTLS